MRRCGSRVRERLRSHLPLAVTAKVDNFVSVFVHGLPELALNERWSMKVARAFGSSSGHSSPEYP